MTFRSPSMKTLPTELRDLLNSPDGPAFEQALDAMVRQREQRLFRALGQLARDLHDAVRRLGGELAHDGVTGIVADARQHLQDVLEMSAQAANRSLDFAERMRPQADRWRKMPAKCWRGPMAMMPLRVLARQARGLCRQPAAHGLADMVLAQSWQDLTGQRIKKVAASSARWNPHCWSWCG